MKTCSYCGQEYPDHASVCACDGQTLASTGAAQEPKAINGVWRGVYAYAEPEKLAVIKRVPFTLKLKQGWLGHFTGTVTEDIPDGPPGTGTIDGYFDSKTVKFTKQMPAACVISPDAGGMTLPGHIIASGHECQQDLPGVPVIYEGVFLSATQIQGTWIIKPGQISLPNSLSMPATLATGFWCAEFITADLSANPTAGPTEPFFEQDHLPASTTGFQPLGKFDVMEAEVLLKKFEAASLRFKISRDDSTFRQMSPIAIVTGGLSGTAPMIEIFIHPDDESNAMEIMGEYHKV